MTHVKNSIQMIPSPLHLNHFWHPKAPSTMPYKDTSAAAIAASALIELDGFLPGRGYLATASNILNSLMG